MAPRRARWRLPGFSEKARGYLSVREWWMLSPHLLGGLLARMEERKRKRDHSAIADIGTRVWIVDLDHGGEMDFVLVKPGHAKPNHRFISILSPFGEALFGARVGDMVHPRFLGHEYSVLITRVEPCKESNHE
ncbi:GreA/GreB family elongation factor [Alloalcanivorax sp. C16-2]|uniref:GreA/GreB family elongation factor n=1 Tax=Alloalcanivorax sp. C16-2 TaxID=3390052 RepID=UPI003970F203